MMDIYICEDNQKQLSSIRRKIENYIIFEQLDMQIVAVSSDPDDILEAARHSQNCGLYFLDIDLCRTDTNGFLLAKKLREIEPRCFIVFVTSHIELSCQTFQYKVEALDFILKDQPETMQLKIRECLLDAYKKHTGGEDIHKNSFSVVLPDGRNFAVRYNDIISFEVSEVPRRLVLHAKQRILDFPGVLLELEDQLPKMFFRCHRSVIVNVDHISSVDYGKFNITMDDGTEYPLSVRKRSALKTLLKGRVADEIS